MRKKLSRLKFCQAVEVMWEDAFGRSCWVGDCEDPDPIQTLGYYMKHSKKGLWLAQGIHTDHRETDKHLQQMFIPLGTILKIRKVKS